jgi:hypothetical protein
MSVFKRLKSVKICTFVVNFDGHRKSKGSVDTGDICNT